MALLTSDVTPSYLTTGVRLFRPTYDVTHLYVRHDSFMFVT